MLAKLRQGICDAPTEAMLRSRIQTVREGFIIPNHKRATLHLACTANNRKDGIVPTQLFTHKERVNYTNQQQVHPLQGEQQSLHAMHSWTSCQELPSFIKLWILADRVRLKP